jgi:hypothetical protein
MLLEQQAVLVRSWASSISIWCCSHLQQEADEQALLVQQAAALTAGWGPLTQRVCSSSQLPAAIGADAF